MEELISVILPVFNVEDYLSRCLDCLAMQSYSNLDIIIVDDGSTDGSGNLCDEYAARDSRARVIHQSNKGVWAARNAGQDVAKGDYLWFLDGDDYFHKDILKIMHDAINQVDKTGRPYDLAIVNHKRTKSLDEDVIGPVVVENIVYSSQDELMYDMFRTNNLCTSLWNKLFRKQYVEDIRSEAYARSQDWDFCFKVFLRIHSGIKIKNDLYYWFDRPASAVNSADYVQTVAKCKTLMFYRNYIELPLDKRKYDHYLLDGLYSMIIIYEERLYGNIEARKDVERHCRAIINSTWWDYLCCDEIPVKKRISRLCKAELPGFSHWIINK